MGDNRLPFPASSSSSRKIATVLFVAVVTLALLVDQTVGHVALTFPPARKYDLDFLDNSRTKGPCGMPKGEWSIETMGMCLWRMIVFTAKDHQRS